MKPQYTWYESISEYHVHVNCRVFMFHYKYFFQNTIWIVEEQEKIEKAKQEAERANQRTNNARGGRGRRGRRGRGGRGQRQTQQTTTRNREGHQPIIIESEDEADGGEVYVGLIEEEVVAEDLSDSTRSSDSDDHFYTDSDEESDGVSGDPDAYYGGYGHCYRCG